MSYKPKYTYKKKFSKSTAGKARLYRGKPVIDATENWLMDVSDRNAERGTAKRPDACAIHLELMEHHPKPEGAGRLIDALVHRDVVMMEYANVVVRYKLSSQARIQTMILDAGGKFQPGKYWLRAVPASVIKNRGRQHSPATKKHGDPNSPKAFSKGSSVRASYADYRPAFRFDTSNTEFRA